LDVISVDRKNMSVKTLGFAQLPSLMVLSGDRKQRSGNLCGCASARLVSFTRFATLLRFHVTRSRSPETKADPITPSVIAASMQRQRRVNPFGHKANFLQTAAALYA
jgi:hypothetical protein